MTKMMRKNLLLGIGGIAIAVVGGGAIFAWTHRVPIRDIVNPAYWARRSRGEDLYEASSQILFHGNRDLKEVALTIDDGPHQPTGVEILDILKEQGVRATYFLVGSRMREQPAIVRRMLAEGHEVANHTQNHFRLPALKPDQMRREINDVDINYFEITGQHLSLLRPPGVQYNNKVIETAKRLGYHTISWSVGARDFEDVTPDFIVQRVLKGAENGSIILLHDDRPSTVTALPRVLSELKRQGYQFVTISEMMAHLPKPIHIKS